MAEKMTLERMALNAQAARRVGDERTAEYWTEQVELANLASIRVGIEQLANGETSRRDDLLSEWDALKGSPEHN